MIYNAEEERAVLGSLLLGGDAPAEAAAILRPEDFYSPAHAAIYSAALQVYNGGARPDVGLVVEQLRASGELELVGGGHVLVSLMAQASSSHATAHAAIVATYAMRRRLQRVAVELEAAAKDVTVPPDVALEAAMTQLAASALPSAAAAADVWEIDDFSDTIDDAADWVVPGLIDIGDRTIIVAPEGQGKTELLRQMAIMAGQGLHPFTYRPIPPARSLIVDLENPARTIRGRSRPVLSRLRVQMGDRYQYGQTWLWHRPGGVNLRSRVGAAELDSVLRKVKPRLVCLGPLYKAFRMDSGTREHQAASEVAEVFDDLRTRHGFALVLEHHAPMQQGNAARNMRPFGSLLWMQWPEFGIKLVPDSKIANVLNVGTWRGSRDERTWPTKLSRGTVWPWEATYSGGLPPIDEEF